MDFLINAIVDWLKGFLVDGILSNLGGLFDSVNQRVGEIAGQVGTTPQAWNGGIFRMIQGLSDTVLLPIAGVLLAITATMELIGLITEKNNMHEVDTWLFFKWVFKTACAVLIVSNTWNIVMGVFDLAQEVVSRSAGVITGTTAIDLDTVIPDLETKLRAMELGELFGLWFQSLFVGVTMWALVIVIFIVIHGRMIEIYMVSSMSPIAMSAMLGKPFGGIGQNYLKTLFALGFQSFLIMVCVGIYAVLVQGIAAMEDVGMAIWTCMGYTVLLCFTLIKTGSLSKSIFGAQ